MLRYPPAVHTLCTFTGLEGSVSNFAVKICDVSMSETEWITIPLPSSGE